MEIKRHKKQSNHQWRLLKALQLQAANNLLTLILEQLVINNGEDDEADDSALTRKDDQPTEKISDAEDEDSKDDATCPKLVKKSDSA